VTRSRLQQGNGTNQITFFHVFQHVTAGFPSAAADSQSLVFVLTHCCSRETALVQGILKRVGFIVQPPARLLIKKRKKK